MNVTTILPPPLTTTTLPPAPITTTLQIPTTTVPNPVISSSTIRSRSTTIVSLTLSPSIIPSSTPIATSNSSPLSPAVVAGIVVLVIAVAVAIAAFFIVRKRRKSDQIALTFPRNQPDSWKPFSEPPRTEPMVVPMGYDGIPMATTYPMYAAYEYYPQTTQGYTVRNPQ